jgi:uncharacterized DUF497 family protein
MNIQFQRDAQKAAKNASKHRVTFIEATTVFQYPLALIFDNKDHSEDEYREIIIGNSIRNRLLLVSFTERNDMIRIISARRADKKEQNDYEIARR